MDTLKIKYDEMHDDIKKLEDQDLDEAKELYQKECDLFYDRLSHNKNQDIIEYVIVYRECMKAFNALKKPQDKEALALLAEYAVDLAFIASAYAHLLHLELKEQADE